MTINRNCKQKFIDIYVVVSLTVLAERTVAASFFSTRATTVSSSLLLLRSSSLVAFLLMAAPLRFLKVNVQILSSSAILSIIAVRTRKREELFDLSTTRSIQQKTSALKKGLAGALLSDSSNWVLMND